MRDVFILSHAFPGDLVVACDSLGAIGPKEGDRVRVPLGVSAQFTARVALAEVLSCGADPLLLILTLSVEPYPFLLEAEEAIRRELRTIGKEELPFLVSSEKNIPTTQTALGITVIGKKKPTPPPPPLPSTLYALGVPSCGEMVIENEESIATLPDLLFVRDALSPVVLPVGSRGIFCEALTLACELCAKLVLLPSHPFSLFASCGPATVFLFPCGGKLPPLPKPVWKVGELFPAKGGDF